MTAPDGLAYDLARLSAAAALALALAFVLQQRFRLRAALVGLQASAAAATAACQGWAQGQGTLVLAAVAVLAVNGVLLPAALVRAAERPSLPGPAPKLSGPLVLVLSALIVAAVVLATQPAALGAGVGLAAEVSAVLLGLAGMVTARGAFEQASGLLAMENGLALLVTGIPHLPFAGTLIVATLALGASGVLFLTAFGGDAGMDGVA